MGSDPGRGKSITDESPSRQRARVATQLSPWLLTAPSAPWLRRDWDLRKPPQREGKVGGERQMRPLQGQG